MPATVSVVVASIVGAPFLDDCLRSLEPQAAAIGADVIAVVCGARPAADRVAALFPWVRVIHREARETVPQLRAIGVDAARGEIVAIIEEHCLAAPDWLHQAVTGLADTGYGAVGGPVSDAGYARLRDWVVYFLEYNGSLPPAAAGQVYELNGANIAYRRDVLSAERPRLDAGYWEASLHPSLLAAGVRFLSRPDMVVRHRGPFTYMYYLQQRYWFSRAFAGHRAADLPTGRKLAYLLTAPLLPLLLLARIARRVVSKRCRLDKFVQSIPLLVPALAVYVAGEWIGYVAGPGDALTKVE